MDEETIKLLLIDIDGVMTDGTKTYGKTADVISKSYNDKDFTAIKMLKKCGVRSCFLSGDKRINEEMAKNRGIDFLYSRRKHEDIPGICRNYDVDPKEVGYVGDDYYDLPALKMVGHSFCPSDSPRAVKIACNHVVWAKSGKGVLSEIYSILFGDRFNEEWLK